MRRSLLVALTVVIAGCSHEQPGNTVLLEAERMVNTAPQKSLQMIYDVDTTGFSNADYALYDLLSVEAAQKMGVIVGNDSLLNRCLDHFERNGTKERLARTLLQLGVTQYSQQHYSNAIDNIKRAEQMIAKGDNQELRHEVFEVLGNINTDASDTKTALHYYRLALDAARKTGNSNWQALDMASLASGYGMMGDTLMKKSYAAQCQPLLKHIGRHEKAVVLTTLAELNLQVGYTMTAKDYLEEAYRLEPQQQTSNLLGDLCALSGRQGHAVDYWYMALNGLSNHVSVDAYKKLINHFGEQGDYQRALDLSQRLNEVYAHMSDHDNPYNLAQLQNQFEDDAKNRRFYQRIITLLSVIIALFVLIGLLALYHRRRVNHYNRIIDQLNANYAADLMNYHKMKDELAGLQQQQQADASLIERKQEEIMALEQKLSEYQDDKQKPAEWNVDNNLLNAEPVYHLHSLAAKGKAATDADWQELYALMEPFLAKLGQYHLNARETSVCSLIKLRFIPSEIAALTVSSPQSVTNMRVRLHTKMFGTSGGARDFDNKIRNL